MESARNKRISDKNKEKLGIINKKAKDEEKKTKSDTTNLSLGSPLAEQAVGNISIIGRGYNILKSKSHESAYRLHECRSQMVLCPEPDSQAFAESKPAEGLLSPFPSLSCTSFISAKSDLSASKSMQKEIQELEPNIKNEVNYTTSDELIANHEHPSAFKSPVENECSSRLQSMYELVGHKNWNQSIDPIEFLTYKNKATELEELIEKLQQEKEKLKENNTSITLSLNCKEKELIAKNRELIDYKNRSTLEMCKLINQIDSLKRSLETQSQIFDHKIFEAQSSMDDEVVRITTKLEDQYQKDLKLNIENMQSNFERIANLPANTIENLLRMCESDNIDWITLQESWEQQRNALCNKILTLETMHNKEIAHIKNSYETKMVYLKTQVDSLSIQLNERKKILDIFESEIMGCKGNTIIKLLGPPVAVEDISYLKELYKSEIFAEQQIHKLEINIFENKVKNLSEEILYHAKNEENHLQELESTRKMADIYREKYESLAIEWEERVSKQLSDLFEESVDKLGIDDIFEQIKNLMYSLKKAEEIQEERLTKLQKFYDNEISSYKRDIEIFKSKILELELFQNDQLKLDSTIQELIENVGSNYVNTVEAMVTCHVTELSLKQLEIYSIEKKFVNEITALKNNHQKEINILQNQLLGAEESKLAIEKELGLLRKSCRCHEVDSLKMKTEEITLELLRHEGMIAIKEETENALNKRIKELENLINLKEENCRKEVENLVAKLVEINVISSAKDDLTRELEEKLNNSEKLLEKTSREVDNLQEICSLLEEKLKNAFKDCVCDKGDFIQNTDIIDKFSLMQTKAEQLESRFLEIFEKMDYLKEENKKLKLNQDKVLAKSKQQILEKNKKLEMDLSSAMREKKEVFEENCKLQVEKNSLLEKLAEKDKILVERNVEKENMLKACSELPQFKKNYEDVANKLEILEAEKLELIKREKIISTEKEMVEKRNKDLEERLRFMNERMDDLMIEFENNKKSDEQGTVSFSLQEVRVLYAEETIEVDNSESATMISGQEKKFRSNSLEYLKYDELYKENKELMEENNSLKAQLKEKKTNLDLSQVQRMGNCKEMILKFRKELSEVTTERNGWMKVAKNLEKERECLREEIENLRKENRNIRAKNSNYEVTLKTFEEKTDCSIEQLVEESDLKESEVNEMKKEIGLLSNYINTLSVKLKEMKANNEKLLRESNAYLRNNEDLSNELEEAWTDRYEIEDQLAKLRRENAFLNMHAAQLEDTNKRISNFVTQGKPSNVSWIKIHKTVENIIDEVLSLKTSFDDGECALPQPGNFDVSKTPSEMRLITESLQAQLQNKKILCDELLIQKKTLEKELKDLEESLKQNDSRFLSQRLFSRESLCSRKSSSDIQNKQSRNYPLEVSSTFETEKNSQNCDPVKKTYEETQTKTLNLLKKHLEDAVGLEEDQFCENLEFGIQGLKKEIQKLEKSLATKKNSFSEACTDEERDFALIEIKYEEEILQLMKEFEKDVGELRLLFSRGNVAEELEEDTRKKYSNEIERIKLYFYQKQMELDEKYCEIYNMHNKKKLTSALHKEREHIIKYIQNIFRQKKEKYQEKDIEKFINNILSNYVQEVQSLRNKCQQNLGEHVSEIKKLQIIIKQLKENLSGAKELNDGEKFEEKNFKHDQEKLLDAENQRLNDLLEKTKEKYDKEIMETRMLWADMLKEWDDNNINSEAENCKLLEINEKFPNRHFEVDKRDAILVKKEQHVSEKLWANCYPHFNKNADFKVLLNQSQLLKTEEKLPESNFDSSSLSNPICISGMEVETDDEKLQIVQERDSLKEMVSSLRLVVIKLLNEKALHDVSLKEFNGEETLYKSLQSPAGYHTTDKLTGLNNITLTFDLSNLIHEINDHSLLHSSNQSRFELDKCLEQVKEDATGLLALSNSENGNFSELIRRVEKEKYDLEKKVESIEKTQIEIREEIGITRDKLAQWERNLEVVSEGYGEEVVEPEKLASLIDLKKKMKFFLSEQFSQSSPETNILEEICKEGYRLQEEWKREKFDLQQQGDCFYKKSNAQIDVADKQLYSLRKFMEEQASEREQEREAFDKEVNNLKESLKAKERNNFLHNRANQEGEYRDEMTCQNYTAEALEAQVKELTVELNNTERSKKALESEFQNAVKKIWSLREVIQDLEVQLAEISERESSLKKKVEKLNTSIEEQTKINANLKDELESCKNENEIKYSNHIKSLEDERLSLRRIVDQVNPEALAQMKSNLRHIETIIIKKTKDLEQMHMSSANVSCSSPSEDVSIRDHLDATRCSTPDEMCSAQPQNILPLEEVDRLLEKITRHTRAEEVALKCIQDLKMQVKNNRKSFEELQTERDILLERADLYLKENSSLKARLEEQRCNAALLQKQLNADLESQINRLEMEVDKLNELCTQKDKQLQDMKEILENTTKALKTREAEALSKSKEENTLFSALKMDLTNTLHEKEDLEKELEKIKEKLQSSLKIPALVDGMLEEKNAEIDRLEKEVSRLSNEMSSLLTSSKDFNEEPTKQVKRKQIKFSEPESFEECVSTISPFNPSIIRNCSDSYTDFRNSSLKIRQPVQLSKMESVSSIGPLQLSPRGLGVSRNWKTSSPLILTDISIKNQSPYFKSDKDFEKMLIESKMQSQIDSKQTEISELKLEIDILKRQLVEMSQELDNSKSQTKEIQQELETRDEDIRKLKNNETNLIMTIESLKSNHMEEIEEFQNKLSFERKKVEKVYEDIRALEVKKIEIEEAFLSLKEDYGEKLNGEQKMVKILMEKIKDLEFKNCNAERKFTNMKEETDAILKESNEAMKLLNKELSDLKKKNEALKMLSKNFSDAQVQVNDNDTIKIFQNNQVIGMPKLEGESILLKQNFEMLKSELDKMTDTVTEVEFNRKEAFSYLNGVKNLLSTIFSNIDELITELETHRKKVMESSVDELAVKVQKELILSAKLDNELLSSIEAKGFTSENQVGETIQVINEQGGGDSIYLTPKQGNSKINHENESVSKIITMYQEATKTITALENERDELLNKVQDHQNIIKFLEENLLAEKERIVAEKERCKEDAKIMELLRINLEKGLLDIKLKDKDLRKEKQLRIMLEREVEACKKQMVNVSESRKIVDLNSRLDSQEEKLASLNRNLDSEKLKNQELRLLLEQNKIERISEKEAQRLLESDFNLLREQNENLKDEILTIKQLLQSREKEICFLKSKINIQEIDIKALSLASDFHRPSTSEDSNVLTREYSFDDINLNHLRKDFPQERVSKSLLLKMQKLNTCVQRHVQESNEMGEALLHLSEETEQMRGLIKKLEESAETRFGEETLVADVNLEQKLWDLEKGKLLMDLETLTTERERAKRDSMEAYKNNEILKLENSKLKAEIQLLEKEANSQIEIGVMKDRINYLKGKYLRAESYRKALVWQKQYLMSSLNGYRSSEEAIWKRMGKLKNNKKKDTKSRGSRCKKFKIVALAVMVIFRLKYIVKRWKQLKPLNICSSQDSQSLSLKQNVLESVISIYSEPINPLAYQTHNLFRPTSTRVLRTPPSRDPGLQNCTPDNETSDYSETFGLLQRNVSTAKVLP